MNPVASGSRTLKAETITSSGSAPEANREGQSSKLTLTHCPQFWPCILATCSSRYNKNKSNKLTLQLLAEHSKEDGEVDGAAGLLHHGLKLSIIHVQLAHGGEHVPQIVLADDAVPVLVNDCESLTGREGGGREGGGREGGREGGNIQRLVRWKGYLAVIEKGCTIWKYMDF